MMELNPFDWTGGPFLTLYAAVATAALLVIGAWSNRLGPHATDATAAGLGTLDLAYLAGGKQRASDTALVGLLEAGAAVPDKRRGVLQLDLSIPLPPEWQVFHNRGESKPEEFQRRFTPHWDRIRAGLVRHGLVPGDAEVMWFRLEAGALLCSVMLFGLCKVSLGVARDRPVGFLVALLLLTVVFGVAVLCPRPNRSRAGGTVLAAARQKHARAARAPLPDEMALAFALTGAAVLAGRDYRWVLARTSASGGSDGGSGGDSSGGDGGGGGGGGGGCGGCSG